MARDLDPTDRLTIRERIVESGDWTIAVPAIATLSVLAERPGSLHRGALLTASAVSAVAGLTNYALSAVTPALPILIAALAVTAICALLSVRGKPQRYVLALTTSDGSRCTVASDSIAELNEIRAFLAEKINRQDCSAIRVFQLQSGGTPEARTLAMNEALSVLADRGETAVAKLGVSEGASAAQAVLHVTTPAREGGSTDYASVLGQITDLHRFYEQHPQAGHIRERLSEMELLMRSGTPSLAQRTRVRELALDLTNIMSAYPHMTQLFNQVTSLASR